jgi:hypothetical protein
LFLSCFQVQAINPLLCIGMVIVKESAVPRPLAVEDILVFLFVEEDSEVSCIRIDSVKPLPTRYVRSGNRNNALVQPFRSIEPGQPRSEAPVRLVKAVQ